MENAITKKGERPGAIDGSAHDKTVNAGEFQFLNEGHKVRIHPLDYLLIIFFSKQCSVG